MLDQQQALSLLAAFEAEEIEQIFAMLPFDARVTMADPVGESDDDTITLGVVGTYGIAFTERFGLAVHAHDSATDAQECFTWKVEELERIRTKAFEVRVQNDIDSLPTTRDVRYI